MKKFKREVHIVTIVELMELIENKKVSFSVSSKEDEKLLGFDPLVKNEIYTITSNMIENIIRDCFYGSLVGTFTDNILTLDNSLWLSCLSNFILNRCTLEGNLVSELKGVRALDKLDCILGKQVAITVTTCLTNPDGTDQEVPDFSEFNNSLSDQEIIKVSNRLLESFINVNSYLVHNLPYQHNMLMIAGYIVSDNVAEYVKKYPSIKSMFDLLKSKYPHVYNFALEARENTKNEQ
ncbi:hypothetical protein [Proteus mirabilis]|uniref:hypothetical protein n=1 Tax=Proteus mirabilis TaxID=584 RepID=UPI0034D78767